MTLYCSECVINWWPHQTRDGCCPECGVLATFSLEPISDDADVRFRSAIGAEVKRQRHEHFETYYFERELRRAAA